MERNNGFDAGGCADAVLLNDWHVIAASDEVIAGALTPATLLERDLVLWRDAAGTVHVWDDLCIHRGSRLSKGFIRNDRVVCPYHRTDLLSQKYRTWMRKLGVTYGTIG